MNEVKELIEIIKSAGPFAVIAALVIFMWWQQGKQAERGSGITLSASWIIETEYGYLDAAISTRSTLDSAAVTAAVPSASNIATAVWGALTSALTTAGSIGKLLVDKITNVAQTGSTVTVSSPVATSGGATIIQGKDYSATIGTQLAWTLSAPPVTTPTSVTFTCVQLAFSKACSYSSPTITLTLTAAETAAFPTGRYVFEIEAVISTLKTALVSGALTVSPDY
jgi:hypothetical protein